MANSKQQKIILGLLKAYLIFFPLGQLVGLKTMILGFTFRLNPIDVIAVLFLILAFVFNIKVKASSKSLSFLMIGLFALLLNFLKPPISIKLEPLFYLIRLSSYFALYELVSTKFSKKNKQMLNKYLIYSILAAALIGFVQYLFFPDIRFLQYLGWDDHLYRLTGAFFDPGFTGYILIFGIVLTYLEYLRTSSKYLLLSTIALTIGVLFTYSRASYLTLLFTSIYYSINKLNVNRTKVIIIIILVAITSVLIVPRRGGSGSELERVYSATARLRNYQETIVVWEDNPLFGVGFNNLCSARQKYLGDTNIESNTCFGSDSSLLLILSTTGVVGMLVFADLVYTVWKRNNKGKIFIRLIIVSLLIHSIFVNSMFYSWIMGLIAIAFAIQSGTKAHSKL